MHSKNHGIIEIKFTQTKVTQKLCENIIKLRQNNVFVASVTNASSLRYLDPDSSRHLNFRQWLRLDLQSVFAACLLPVSMSPFLVLSQSSGFGLPRPLSRSGFGWHWGLVGVGQLAGRLSRVELVLALSVRRGFDLVWVYLCFVLLVLALWFVWWFFITSSGLICCRCHFFSALSGFEVVRLLISTYLT